MSVEGSSDTTREFEFDDVVAIRDAGKIEIEGVAGAVAVFTASGVAGPEIVAGSDTGSGDSGAKTQGRALGIV
jgi:hypothetical protein